MDRLYLYALTRRDGTWSYIGETVDPVRRATNWSHHYPDERLRVLMIGAEKYVLEMERKLIAHCWARGIPIRNKRETNAPLALLRERGRRGMRRAIELHPDLPRKRGAAARRPEVRAKLSATSKAAWRRPEYRAKVCAALRGKVRSPETRAKMSAAQRGKSSWNKGKSLSAEHRARISAALCGNPKCGRNLGLARHVRWHINRGIRNPSCQFCITEPA